MLKAEILGKYKCGALGYRPNKSHWSTWIRLYNIIILSTSMITRWASILINSPKSAAKKVN